MRDELALAWLCQDADAAGLRLVRFHEPDLSGSLTAVALEPDGGRLVRGLRLALTGGKPSTPSLGGEEVTT